MARETITAEWARKTAQGVLSAKVEQQINQCLNNIEDAVKRNDMACDVNVYPHELVITDLNKRGFKTRMVDSPDPREQTYLHITW